MAQTCPHGFAPADCLICEALGRAQTATKTKTRPTTGRSRGAGAPGKVSPSEVLAPGSGPRRRSAGGSLALVAIGVVLAVLAVFALASLVFSILHILGLVLGALIAGWVGYRIGHFRGSRGN